MHGEDDGLCIYELSELLNWPIVSDICGGLRLDSTRHGVLHHADVMFYSSSFQEHFKLDSVLQFGERIVSQRVKSWIRKGSDSSEEFVHVVLTGSSKRIDEHFTVTHRIEGNISRMWHMLKTWERAHEVGENDVTRRTNGATEGIGGKGWLSLIHI